MYETVRQFKGVWIPKEVWLDEKLTYFEKAVYAEIDSLDGEDGCFASNKYLAGFFGCTERHIKRALAHLCELGYVKTEMFDGRKRVIKICRIFSETEQMQGVTKMSPGDINVTAGVTKMSPQRGQECHPRNSYNIDDNIAYISSDDDIESSVVVGEENKRESLKSGVMLSGTQIDSLLELLSVEEFDEYCEKLGAWKQKHPGKTCRSDYKIILQWAKEDRQTEE
nr:MAG TPA: helix-turn-helix domain protein [Caudoviricetes sp.]